MGYPFLQVKMTAVVNVGNTLIVISISGTPVTLAPCHGLPKLKQCSSIPTAWRTSCFPTIYGSQLQSFAGSGGRLTGARRSKCHETLELCVESWERDILHLTVYVAGFRLFGISSRMAFQNWEVNSDSSVVPSCCQLHPRQNCCISWAAAAVGRVLVSEIIWNILA